jgi:hypothetical protein
MAGDIVVVEAGEDHAFVNRGPGKLDMVCIHARGLAVLRRIGPEIGSQSSAQRWLRTDVQG